MQQFFILANHNTCANNVLDGDETGIDCGGSVCRPCPCGGGGTFVPPLDVNGNKVIRFKRQCEIDSFGVYNYETIDGSLYIESDSILSLSSLCSIRRINRSMRISRIGATSLEGLQNLDSIGYLFLIEHCNNLINVDELSNLKTVNGFIGIHENDNLTNINGFINVTSEMPYLRIHQNSSLTDISGVSNATVSEELYIAENPSLSSLPSFNLNDGDKLRVYFEDIPVDFDLSFLNNVDTLLELQMVSNPNLSSLNELSNIENISNLYVINNSSITSLNGLDNLLIMINLHINSNSSLDDFCALSNLMSQPYPPNLDIVNNLYNPSYTDFQNGDCAP